jgi:hypothetical protein
VGAEEILKVRSRITPTLLLLVLLLGGFIWFFERDTDNSEEQVARARFALRIQPDQVSRLGIVSPALKLQMSKQGDGWHIVEPMQTVADGSRIEELLMTLALLPRSQIITEAQLKRRHQKPADYGLDQPRWKISLGDRDSEMTLLVGRDAPTGDALYLQVSGQRDVFVTPTNMLAALPSDMGDFRSRRLVPGDPDDAVRLELRSHVGFVQAVRAAGGPWKIAKPIVTRADSVSMAGALRQIFAARIVDFEASSKVGASLYGFDEPALQFSILARDGAIEQTLLLGKAVEGRTNLVYATKQGDDEIFTVDRGLLAGLSLSTDDLRDRHLMPLPVQRITGMRIDEGDHSLTLEQTNGEWFITSPRVIRANQARVQLALAEWAGARVRAFDDQPGTNLAALGLSPPAARISFVSDIPTGDSAKLASVTYEVSSVADAGVTRVVRVSGEQTLLHIDGSTLATLPPRSLYLRDEDVLTIDPGAVRNLVFEQGGLTNVVELDISNKVPAAVSEVLKLLQPLHARELVTEDTRDLTLYGLQPPESTLTVGLKSPASPGRIVMFGKPAPGGGRYAMVQGVDLIFTLDERMGGDLWKPSMTNEPARP